MVSESCDIFSIQMLVSMFSTRR